MQNPCNEIAIGKPQYCNLGVSHYVMLMTISAFGTFVEYRPVLW